MYKMYSSVSVKIFTVLVYNVYILVNECNLMIYKKTMYTLVMCKIITHCSSQQSDLQTLLCQNLTVLSRRQAQLTNK